MKHHYNPATDSLMHASMYKAASWHVMTTAQYKRKLAARYARKCAQTAGLQRPRCEHVKRTAEIMRRIYRQHMHLAGFAS